SSPAVVASRQANLTSQISDVQSPDGAATFALQAEALKAIKREGKEGERGPARYDEPGEAAEFFRLKRVPTGETVVPIERYLTAREQMRSMRQYSTVQENFLPAHNELPNQAEASVLGDWTPLGPGNIGGRTRALLIHPNNPNVMYAAGVAG